MRSSLLEIPPQLVEDVGLERRHQLIPDNLFGPLTDVRELRRHDDRSVHAGSARSRAAWRKRKTRNSSGIGDDVDDHAAAGGMNADRQAVREVPHRAGVTLAGGTWGRSPGRSEATSSGGLTSPHRAEPHQIGVFDDGVEHHQTLDGVIQRHGFAQPALRLADRRAQRALIDVVDARACRQSHIEA